jgi:hypothetical protein
MRLSDPWEPCAKLPARAARDTACSPSIYNSTTICRGLVCSSPIVTANCLRAGNNFRTFPVGADMGHVIKIDDTLPGKFASDAYCDALQRECGSTVG